MPAIAIRLAALLACLALLGACQDRHEPTKPTVAARA
jgi:ABC-type uncharacterized transport system auxiliary subunit